MVCWKRGVIRHGLLEERGVEKHGLLEEGDEKTQSERGTREKESQFGTQEKYDRVLFYILQWHMITIRVSAARAGTG